MSRTDFERYLAGEPLNEDLAAIRDGRQIESEDSTPAWAKQFDSIASAGEGREPDLVRGERIELKFMREQTGWAVFLRLQKRAIEARVSQARLLSEQDPLDNRDKVAQAWALVSMYRLACEQMILAVEQEIQKLEDENANLLERHPVERETA